MKLRSAVQRRLQVERLDERIAPASVIGGGGGIVGVVQPPSGEEPPAEVSLNAGENQSGIINFIGV